MGSLHQQPGPGEVGEFTTKILSKYHLAPPYVHFFTGRARFACSSHLLPAKECVFNTHNPEDSARKQTQFQSSPNTISESEQSLCRIYKERNISENQPEEGMENWRGITAKVGFIVTLRAEGTAKRPFCSFRRAQGKNTDSHTRIHMTRVCAHAHTHKHTNLRLRHPSSAVHSEDLSAEGGSYPQLIKVSTWVGILSPPTNVARVAIKAPCGVWGETQDA